MDVVKTLVAQTIANLSLAIDPRDYAGNDSHAYRHEVTGKLLTLMPGMTDEDMGCASSILAISASTTVSPTRFRKVLRPILEREHKISSSIKSILNDFAEYHISDGRMKGKIPLSGVSSMMPPAPFLHQCYYGGADRGGSNNFDIEQSSILAYQGLREGMPQDVGIMQKVPKAIGPPPKRCPSVQD